MTAKLHLALAHFHPALMNSAPAGPESYGHDDRATHLILQPFVFPSGDTTDILDPVTYVKTWKTGSSPPAAALAMIGQSTAENLKKGKIQAVPVPFPPGTKLSLTISGQTRSGAPFPTFTDTRELGGSSSGWDHLSGDGPTGWPAFAVLSNALPTVRTFSQLDGGNPDGPQHAAVRAALIGTFSEMVKEWGASGPAPDERGAVFDQVVKPGLVRAPLSDTAKWIEFLNANHASGQTNAAWSYDKLVGRQFTKPPPISLPQPAWVATALEKRGDLFLGSLKSLSYLDALWNEFPAILAKDSDPARFGQILSRLFGFGERLAWPAARLDGGSPTTAKRFMVLKTSLAGTPAPGWIKSADWVATNMVSLAGQVFRVQPFNPGDPPTKLTSVSLTVGGAQVGDPSVLAGELNDYFGRLASAATGAPIAIRPTLGPIAGIQSKPASAPDRLVVFAARKARLARLADAACPGKRILFAIPEGLLDLVDDTPRSIGGGQGELRTSGTARRGIFRKEILDFAGVLGGAAAFHYRRSINLSMLSLGIATGNAFVVSASDRLAPREAAVDDFLGQIADGTGNPPSAALWIAQKGATGDRASTAIVPISAASVARDYDGKLLVIDPDPNAADSLSSLLFKMPGFGAAGALPVVDLVFTVSGDSLPFDLVEYVGAEPAKAPEIALAQGAVTRLALTADRILHGVAMTWRGLSFDIDGEPVDPRTDQAADANKLRLSLQMPGGASRDLSLPDALLPLGSAGANPDRPWFARGPVIPAGPQAWYWLAEHFDQDSSEDGEGTRFVTWTQAGKAFRVTGYTEHQYGHRLSVEPLSLDLRRGSDVENPGAIRVSTLVGSAPVSKTLPLLTAVETAQKDPANPAMPLRRIKVGFQREAAQVALERARQRTWESRPHGDDHRSEFDPFADIRSIYRSLAELRDAIRTGKATLIIEPWTYSASRALEAPDRGSGPAFASGLIARPAIPVAIPPPAAGSPLAAVLAALDGTFDRFCSVLDNAINSSPAEPFWATLYDADSNSMGRNSSLVRVGLRLERPIDATVDTIWANGSFVPIAAGGPEAGRQLADSAQSDLTAYVTTASSRLRNSLRWLPIGPRSNPPPGGRSALADPRIVGSGGRELLVLDAPLDPVDDVIDLFYLPHACTLPQAHPALLDRQATFEFVGFLLQIIEDVLAGSTSGRISLATRPVRQATKLRADLSDLIGRPGGVADQIMRRWRPVYSEPSALPNDKEGALFWFAHKVRTALETISAATAERPSIVVRALMVKRPTLYYAARAICIAPFKTALPSGVQIPKAADDFNHSTFSDQLSEVRLTKQLIDDDDKISLDASIFGVAAFRGGLDPEGTRRLYLVDVLQDKKYDDTIEILSTTYKGIDPLDFSKLGEKRSASQLGERGDTVAFRGDDAIQPVDRQAKIAGPIEANIVHAFPHWRLKELKEGKRLGHAYYLLPERLVPPRPRPVDAYRAVDGTRAASDTIIVDVPAPTQPGKLPQIDLRAKWPQAYTNATAGLDKIEILPSSSTSEKRSFRRIEKAGAASPGDSLKALPIARADDLAQNGGWHLLTTTLSHFWFELDLQKLDQKLVNNLDDDVYEVEVEMWPGTPITPPAPVSPIPSSPTGEDPLLNAFRRWRQVQAGGTAGDPPNISDLPAALAAWFLKSPSDAAPYYGRLLFDETAPTFRATPPASFERSWGRRFRIFRRNDAWRIVQMESDPIPAETPGLGAVVGFEILARTDPGAPKGPPYDASVPLSKLSALIRLSVLDHPFHVSRARVRVLRNWRDVDGDGVPDIDPAFVLTDGYSDWNTEGRDPQVLDTSILETYHVPPPGRELRVVAKGADSIAELNRWLGAIDAPAGAPLQFDYGEALPALVLTPVFEDKADGKPKSLWEAACRDPSFNVSAVLHRTVVDPSLRFGAQGEVARLKERDVSTPHQILGPVSASNLDKLLTGLRPVEVKSIALAADITWRDASNMPVLTISLPLVFTPRAN